MSDDEIELLPKREWLSAIAREQRLITAQALRELAAFKKAAEEIRFGSPR